VVTDFFKKWIALNSNLIALSACALYTTAVAFIKSLSDVSQQLLLVIEKNKKLIKCYYKIWRNVMRNSI
jgi:hexosaminidase